MKRLRSVITFLIIFCAALAFAFALFTVFFDQAVIVRKGTLYRAPCAEKLVALTFDDGPSAEWTPQVLEALRESGARATFFMLGKHVEEFPEVARRVVAEGHEIGNHSYKHDVLLYYTMDELEEEIRLAEQAIWEATGCRTKYFRPPKAWMTPKEKNKVRELGYQIVLWSLNSKDWVAFSSRQMLNYILRNVRPGDIILFHDSGGVFSTEGSDRSRTAEVIPPLAQGLRERGYRLVTISELLGVEDERE